MMVAYPATGEQDAATNALVDRLRHHALPKDAYLTGPNAGNVTFANLIGSRLPWLIAVVVALSMALLLVVFRSVVIAVKAALMNLLSVCAAYGVLVAVDAVRLARARARLPGADARHHLGAGVPVRDLVRPVHGLRGVPAVEDPRGVRPARRQRAGRRARAGRRPRG